MSDTEELIPDFDAAFLGHSSEIGGGHLETARDVAKARDEEDGLLLSPAAEKFVKLIVLHGMLPSQAYTQAFAREDEFGTLIVPDMPAYQARILLKLPEVKQAIEAFRAEVREWCKTEVEEVEMAYRQIMLSPAAKDSDRIAAGKALAALKGYEAAPEMLQGASITISLPFAPQQLGHRSAIIDQPVLDKVVSE